MQALVISEFVGKILFEFSSHVCSTFFQIFLLSYDFLFKHVHTPLNISGRVSDYKFLGYFVLLECFHYYGKIHVVWRSILCALLLEHAKNLLAYSVGIMR